MQSTFDEINKFVKSISEDELRENLELRNKLKTLLRSIEGQKVKDCGKTKKQNSVLRYLNLNMLSR